MACSSGGDEGAESKCSIKRDPSGYFNNPFPEFRFLSPFELFKLARAKNNKNLPFTEEDLALQEEFR